MILPQKDSGDASTSTAIRTWNNKHCTSGALVLLAHLMHARIAGVVESLVGIHPWWVQIPVRGLGLFVGLISLTQEEDCLKS